MVEEERRAKLANLAFCRQQAEKAYDDMYEAHSFSGASTCYTDAKDFFHQAISLANELGLAEEAQSLEKRLDHVKAVFKSQFVQ